MPARKALSTPAKKRPISRLEGLAPTVLHYVLARDAAPTPLLVVAPDDEAAAQTAQELQALGRPDVFLLAGEVHTPFEVAAVSAREALARLGLRRRLLANEAPQTLVCSAPALQGSWMPEEAFVGAQASLRRGEDVDRDALLRRLIACGYQRVNQVEDEGTFAVRGGTVDVYPPGFAQPLRLDLFGDELAEIRAFVPQTQALGAHFASWTLSPIRDVIYAPQHVACAVAWLRAAREHSDVPTSRIRELIAAVEGHQYFFGIEALWPIFYPTRERVWDALHKAYPQLAVTDVEACRALWRARAERAQTERVRAVADFGPQPEVEAHVAEPQQLCADVVGAARWQHAPVWFGGEATEAAPPLRNFAALGQALAVRRKQADAGDLLGPLLDWLRHRGTGYGRVAFACNNHGSAMRLRELLAARKVRVRVVEAPLPVAAMGTSAKGRASPADSRGGVATTVHVAPLACGIDDPELGLAVLSDAELFGSAPVVRERRRRTPRPEGLNTLRDMRAGDLTIHQDHGIGRFEGLKRLVVDGVDGDFVQLTYADGDRLFVPVYRLSLLKRYHGSAANAQLDKLGGVRWERAKRRVRDAVLSTAHTLLALEARRRAQQGFALPPPKEAYAAFVSSFPFEETPDQHKAIVATLADMQREVPMDRLVCGDVGFGKTEVAMRATFLAIEAGKQVAVLVPTTVLAEQHRQNFAARLAPFGAVVESLSRFRSPKEAKEVLARLKNKQVDVLIGTHRLLSGDAHFADLGLLVVDEEQRFGVKHKERIKQLRAHVHVLTLSATPIPRTLHMATAGLRDLSLIQTPPLERSAIRTEVLRYDAEVLQEAIRRELHRGGQVFVVSNRVQGIDDVATQLRLLVPEAEVLVGHGQMSGHELEEVMVRFVHRKAQILLCTTIIESGIDIPSVNTMVVLRADTFGLSQLYQLRGRIGRGRERAYAYLMLPQNEALSKDALARLHLLKRFSELGSGFQVASHDLELRGAGDLLGADQSGHIASVGFELYTQLLHEAVEQARGQGPRQDVEPDIKVAVSAVFPERYMPEPIDRITFYQRMAEAADEAAIYEVIGEVQEIFGPVPEEAEALVALMLLRGRLRQLGATTLSAALDVTDREVLKVGVMFAADAAVDRLHLVELCQQPGSVFRLLPSGRLAIATKGPALQPADADRGRNEPYVLGKDLLTAVQQALGPLRVLHR